VPVRGVSTGRGVEEERPAGVRTLYTTTSAARVRIEILFQEMVALGERLREAEKAYAEERGTSG